jgi:hypothetical protein
MRLLVLVAVVLASRLATAGAPVVIADDQDSEMTEEERAAEEEAEQTISDIEDETFGRPVKKHGHHHHRKPAVRSYAIASTGFLGGGFGGSFYVTLNKYLAVRTNAVAYPYHSNPAASVAVAVLAHEAYDEENQRSGHYIDGGASLMLFPRQVLDGPMLELGALVRDQDSHLDDWRSVVHDRKSITLAGRVLVGWTWTIGRQYFISMALGASRGYAWGTGATADRNLDPTTPLTPYRIAEWDTRFECYTRVGFMFGGGT